MRIKFILLFVLICSTIFYPQRLYKITVESDGKQETLSFIEHDGLDFVSCKELTKILSGSNFYNSDAAKMEMKFREYSLKFTANSQFIILIMLAEFSLKKIKQLGSEFKIIL